MATLSAADAALVQLDQQLCFKLYAASRLMIKAYKPMLDDLEITYPQYLVLMVLWESGAEITVGELGDRLLLDTGTLTPLLKRMQASGLVQRTRGREDERQVWVGLTSQGQSLQPRAIAWVKEARGDLASDGLDAAQLRVQLAALIDLLPG